MEKILFNLVSNAFKFTSEGGQIEIQVDCRQLTVGSEKVASSQPAVTGQAIESGQNTPTDYRLSATINRLIAKETLFMEISVSDTGSGIPKKQLPHIFDRFYQADDSYTKDGKGTGIGLALTKELVKLHHRSIEVKSGAGVGTTF